MFYQLKFAFRSLLKNRLYSVINVAGLAVSLAACSFILLWVHDELSYDRFHRDADEIYMAVSHFTNSDILQNSEIASGLFAPEAKANFTAVKDYCRIRDYKAGYILAGSEKVGDKNVFVADSNFFTFFNFPIVAGYSPNLLRNPDEVVISESLARELFGSENPVGKTIRTKGTSEDYKDVEKSYSIAAVMKDIPSNTYLSRADLVIPQQSDPDRFYANYWTGWGGCEFLSFIRVKKGTDMEQLAKDITNLQTVSRDYRYFTLQPLVDLHLHNLLGEPTGIRTIWIFIWIACAILAISCINYVNLVTGRSARRNREIGVKKIFGAGKMSLFLQLMSEAVILFLIALIVAVLLNVLFISAFNELSGKEIYFGWDNRNIWMMYGLMFLTVMILAGVYPALSLSSFKSLNILQDKLINKGNGFFRKSLIVFQFIASIVMIAATVTLESQLTYIRHKELGYDREQVFTFQMRNMARHFPAVQQELMQNPAILNVNGASGVIENLDGRNNTSEWEGKTGEGAVSYSRLYADSTFIRNMAIKFVEGGDFKSGVKDQFIINETAVKTMGLTAPVVGKWMVADFGIRGTIVGVVKDFHFQSLYREITPLVIFNASDWANTLYVRTTAKDADQAIAAVQKLWKEYNQNYLFDYSFMDESFEQMYRSDIRTGRLFGIFSLIAIMISCMGLFGLVTYTAEAKTHETGIRKVFGAGIGNIVLMLTKEFILLVFIAMLFAFPFVYFWIDKLLQDFAYRITVGWKIFALSGVITIAVTLLTVIGQAVKAATANPVDAIRKY
ncbi:MAG: ABC transporter permease [Tannerella sp.]|jgi:ABC-type antimicrobial peptide transport system permease subunit|nr:ABC transporter permease [Tannerella sp.]